VTGTVAERERLEKGDDDRFLFGGQGREAGRIPIRRPQRTDQRLHSHRRIVRTPEGVTDESREIVPPRLCVEVAEPPEGESLDVRVSRVIARGVEGLGVVVAVDCIATAEGQRRHGFRIGAKRLEGAPHDLVGRDGDTSCGVDLSTKFTSGLQSLKIGPASALIEARRTW